MRAVIRCWCVLYSIITSSPCCTSDNSEDSHLKSLTVEVCPSMPLYPHQEMSPSYVFAYFDRRFTAATYRCRVYNSANETILSSNMGSSKLCSDGMAVLRIPTLSSSIHDQSQIVSLEVQEKESYIPVVHKRIKMQHLVQASITFMGHGWYSVFCDLGCTRGLTGCALLSESLQVISYVTVSEKRQFHKMNAVHRVARGNFTHRRNGNSLKLFMVQALSGHQLVGAVHHINISKSNESLYEVLLGRQQVIHSFSATGVIAIVIGVVGVLCTISAILTIIIVRLKGVFGSRFYEAWLKCDQHVSSYQSSFTNVQVSRLTVQSDTETQNAANDHNNHFTICLEDSD